MSGRPMYDRAWKALEAAHEACFRHPDRDTLGMSHGPFSGVNSTGPACKKCNDTGFIAIWSQNGRYAHPGPVPDDARGYAEARCLECLANPGGFDGPTGAE